MNKKLLTAALSATLVLGAGVQNVHADEVTIPTAPEDKQTVNTTTGGVANTGSVENKEENEKIKTSSTLDPNATPEDGDTKENPSNGGKEETNKKDNKDQAPQDKENNKDNKDNKEKKPADTGKKEYPAKENTDNNKDNKDNKDNKKNEPANGGKKVFPAEKENTKEKKPANGGKKIFPGQKEDKKNDDKNNKPNDKVKVFPAKGKKEDKKDDKKEDKNAGENPKTGIATAGVLAATASLASAGYAVTKKRNK